MKQTKVDALKWGVKEVLVEMAERGHLDGDINNLDIDEVFYKAEQKIKKIPLKKEETMPVNMAEELAIITALIAREEVVGDGFSDLEIAYGLAKDFMKEHPFGTAWTNEENETDFESAVLKFSIRRREQILSAKVHWGELGDIPVNKDDELEEDFYSILKDMVLFPKGSDKEEVWLWFEENYDISVVEDLP